jgi:hypothetical protein
MLENNHNISCILLLLYKELKSNINILLRARVRSALQNYSFDNNS